jgi:transcriptional regulator GlxA family with amidase domain
MESTGVYWKPVFYALESDFTCLLVNAAHIKQVPGRKTGTTPARVVERLRVDLARGRIKTTAEPVERIAEAVGFGDAEDMRRAFIRMYGQPPQSIRRAIKS